MLLIHNGVGERADFIGGTAVAGAEVLLFAAGTLVGCFYEEVVAARAQVQEEISILLLPLVGKREAGDGEGVERERVHG